MWRALVFVLIAGTMAFGVAQPAHAQEITLSQLVELFIEFEIIAPEKAETARRIIVNYGADTSVTTQSTEQAEPGLQTDCPAVVLTRNLSPGMRGEQVEQLQAFLAEFPQWYPEALVTGYYGPLTQRAIERYQIDQQIVWSGTPRTTGFGNTGPKTRESLRQCHDGSTGDHPATQRSPGEQITLDQILAQETYDGFIFEAEERDQFQPAFFRQYGKYNFDTFDRYPALVTLLRQIKPDFSRFDVSASTLNKAAAPQSDRTMLILEGCAPQACDGTWHTIVYDFKNKQAYILEEARDPQSGLLAFYVYGSPDAVAREVLFTAFLRSREERTDVQQAPADEDPSDAGETSGGSTTGAATAGADTAGGAATSSTTTDATGGTGSGEGTGGGSTDGGATTGGAPPPPPPPPPPSL